MATMRPAWFVSPVSPKFDVPPSKTLSEHSLRRKTPNGTLTAAYDGTPSEATSDRHTCKQFLVDGNVPNFSLPQNAARLRPSKSFAARERDRILSQELQQANTGLQNFAFESQDKSFDVASTFHTFCPAPQVDSVLHGPPLTFNAFGRPPQFHSVPNGFLAPVQAPLGPTASYESGPYGPYWPNGAYVPYRPAAYEARKYPSVGGNAFVASLYDSQVGDLSGRTSQRIHKAVVPSTSGDYLSLSAIPNYYPKASNFNTASITGHNHENSLGSLGYGQACHYYPSPVSSMMRPGGLQSRVEQDLRNDEIFATGVEPQNGMHYSQVTTSVPTASNATNQMLAWAHMVYAKCVKAMQSQALFATQARSEHPRKVFVDHPPSAAPLNQHIVGTPNPTRPFDIRDSALGASTAKTPLSGSGPQGLKNRRLSTGQTDGVSLRGFDEHHAATRRTILASDNQYPAALADVNEVRDKRSDDIALEISARRALELLAGACLDSSKRTEALLLGGCLAYVLGEFQQALQWYTRILDHDAHHVEAISNLAATYLSLNRRGEAEAYWRLAVNLRPAYFEAAEHVIGLLCFDRRHKEAVRIIDHIQDSLRYSVSAQSTALGSYDLRVQRYQNATVDNGRLMSLVHAKGNILYNMRDYRGAAKAFEEVVLIAASQRDGGIDQLIHSIVYALTRCSINPHDVDLLSPEKMLLAPKKALNTAKICFGSEGTLPGVVSICDLKARDAAISITSNSLLSLAKIFQDAITSNSVENEASNGRSVTDILALYYLSLSLQPSPSTANNVGILLASVQPSRACVSDDYEEMNEASLFPGVVPGSGIHLALLYYRYGLKLDSRHAHLYTNLGSLLKDIGQLSMAIPMYQKAVDCDPNFDIALANLANAVKDQGKVAEAIKHYQRAVHVNPNFAEAVCGLANALNSVCNWTGRGGITFPGGIFDRYHVDDKGGLTDSQRSTRSNASGWMKSVVEIVDNQLLEGKTWGSGSVQSLYYGVDFVQMLRTLLKNSVSDQTLEAVDRFLELATTQCWEGTKVLRLVERIMRMLGRKWFLDRHIEKTELPAASYRRLHLPSTLTAPKAPTVLPFHTFTFPLSAQQIRLISQRNGLRVSTSTLRASWLPPTIFPPPAPPSSHLIVGYVSSDFNNHPLAHLMQSVFGLHDSKRVRAICYATTASDKSVHRQQIEREAPVFRDASSWSIETLINQIVQDGVHVLINLNGYTRGARNEVFAARPAPIQMSFMGFAGTLGAEWCDYLLADEISIPQSTLRPHRGNQSLDDLLQDSTNEDTTQDWVYSENIIFARDASFCCDHRQSAPGCKEPNATWEEEQMRRWRMRREVFPDIPGNAVIFGNFNQLYKIDPTTFRTWLRILDQVPNSYLWLLQFPADGATNLLRTANAWAGPAIASRIKFTDVAPKPLHIARGCIVDLFLDTPECNAHTTAADCLWSGTPLLTCARYEWKMCSRIAASILAGAVDRKTPEGAKAWDELVAADMDEYEERAVRLGRGLKYDTGTSSEDATGRLVELRELIWKRRWTCPLFDTKRWVRDLELAYEEAWRRWINGRGGDIYLKDLDNAVGRSEA